MADKQTLDVYAGKVDEYAAMRVPKAQSEALARFMAELPEGGHVLDLGCGPGLHAAEMARAGFRVTATDASPEFVAAAKARGVDARVALFDDLDDEATFDGVWASFSLLHAPRAALPDHIAAIKRALRPGGQLFLSLKLGQGEERDSLGRFYSYFSEEELREYLSVAGFEITSAVTGEGKGLAGQVDPYILFIARG